MLTRHDTRARLACERGQATVNWLAVMVGLTAVAAALVLALPSVAPKVTCAMQNAVAKVSGGAVPAKAARGGPSHAGFRGLTAVAEHRDSAPRKIASIL